MSQQGRARKTHEEGQRQNSRQNTAVPWVGPQAHGACCPRCPQMALDLFAQHKASYHPIAVSVSALLAGHAVQLILSADK